MNTKGNVKRLNKLLDGIMKRAEPANKLMAQLLSDPAIMADGRRKAAKGGAPAKAAPARGAKAKKAEKTDKPKRKYVRKAVAEATSAPVPEKAANGRGGRKPKAAAPAETKVEKTLKTVGDKGFSIDDI